MVKFTFKGLMAPVFTPFKSDFSLNLEIIPEYVNYLNQNKIRGILVHGTTGEGPSMSFEERKHVSEVWLKEAKKYDIHVMLQVGGAPFPDVIALAKHAEAIGADSILTLPELYIKPTTINEAIEYLKMISAAAPNTPLFYYNIPMFTDDKLNMADLITQAKKSVNTFKGIKFTSNDFEKGKAALKASGDDCVLFLGAETLLLDAFSSGFDSSIGTSFNMMMNGADIVKSVQNKDMNGARKHQDKINAAVVAITQYGNWVESMKVAMCLLTNIDVGPTRPPLKRLSKESVAKMNDDLVKLGYKTYFQNK